MAPHLMSTTVPACGSYVFLLWPPRLLCSDRPARPRLRPRPHPGAKMGYILGLPPEDPAVTLSAPPHVKKKVSRCSL